MSKPNHTNLLGAKIRARRKELNMTQSDLADLVGYSDRSTIAKLETDGVNITKDRLYALAEALMLDPTFLLDDREVEAPPLEYTKQRKFLFSKVRDGSEEDIRKLYKLWQVVDSESELE